MSNKEWTDFLVKEWHVSVRTAKTMLHLMHECKKDETEMKKLVKHYEKKRED